MKTILHKTIALSLLVALASAMTGCGAKEEEKPSAASGYYDGQMAPKAAPGGGGGKVGAD